MAQYFKVLSPSDKEELRKFYPNINDDVQYIVTPEDQSQQFQGQQVKNSFPTKKNNLKLNQQYSKDISGQ